MDESRIGSVDGKRLPPVDKNNTRTVSTIKPVAVNRGALLNAVYYAYIIQTDSHHVSKRFIRESWPQAALGEKKKAASTGPFSPTYLKLGLQASLLGKLGVGNNASL